MKMQGLRDLDTLDSPELHLVMRTLALGEEKDVARLVELDILNGDADAVISMAKVAMESWRTADDYKPPRSVKDALARPDDALARSRTVHRGG